MNAIRKATLQAIFETLKEVGEPVTLENVQSYGALVPDVGEITAEEFAAVTASGTTLTHPEALERLRKLEEELHTARQAVVNLQHEERLAKTRLADALAEWTRDGAGPMTQAQLAREYIRASVEERRQRAEAGLPATAAQARRGRSYLDNMLAGSRGGGGDDFARKQHQVGHRRGALPASARGRTISPEHAASIRQSVGLPSARPFTPTPKNIDGGGQ